MEPAWRQQGRGRGRSQEAQVERSRPLQKERERPGTATGRGVRTKTGSAPEPPHGDETLHEPTPPIGWCEFINSSLWSSGLAVQSKFEEIRKSNQAAAQRLVESHFSSSSSDEDDDNSIDDGDHKEGKRGKILASAFTTYTDQTGEQPGIAMATPL